jgi:hypothetical protein
MNRADSLEITFPLLEAAEVCWLEQLQTQGLIAIDDLWSPSLLSFVPVDTSGELVLPPPLGPFAWMMILRRWGILSVYIHRNDERFPSRAALMKQTLEMSLPVVHSDELEVDLRHVQVYSHYLWDLLQTSPLLPWHTLDRLPTYNLRQYLSKSPYVSDMLNVDKYDKEVREGSSMSSALSSQPCGLYDWCLPLAREIVDTLKCSSTRDLSYRNFAQVAMTLSKSSKVNQVSHFWIFRSSGSRSQDFWFTLLFLSGLIDVKGILKGKAFSLLLNNEDIPSRGISADAAVAGGGRVGRDSAIKTLLCDFLQANNSEDTITYAAVIPLLLNPGRSLWRSGSRLSVRRQRNRVMTLCSLKFCFTTRFRLLLLSLLTVLRGSGS